MAVREDTPEDSRISHEPVYTVIEVAALLRVSPATVSRMISNGELRKLGFRRTIRIPASAVTCFITGDSTQQVRP